MNKAKCLQDLKCNIHQKPIEALNLNDEFPTTLCNSCLTLINNDLNSKFITYKQLDLLLNKQLLDYYEEYSQLNQYHNTINNQIETLINILRDFLKGFNQNINTRRSLVVQLIVIERYFNQANLDEFDLIQLRQSIKQVIAVDKNEYILKDSQDLYRINQSLLSMINVLQESKEQCQNICDEKQINLKQNARIKQEQLIAKGDKQNTKQYKKLQKSFEKKQVSSANNSDVPENNNLLTDLQPCQDKSQYHSLDQFKNTLVQIYQSQELCQALIDQGSSIMLIREAKQYHLLQIWNASHAPQTFCLKQLLSIPKKSKVQFGSPENRQIIANWTNMKTNTLKIIIYNLNERTNKFEQDHFLELKQQRSTTVEIKAISENQLLILIDMHIQLIQYYKDKYTVMIRDAQKFHCYAYDQLNQIFYFSQTENRNIYRSVLGKQTSKIIVVNRQDTNYKDLVLLNQSKLIAFSNSTVEIIDIVNQYRIQIIRFEAQIYLQSIIIEDFIIYQTKSGNIYSIYNDNVTQTKQFLGKLPLHTKISYNQHLNRVFVINHPEHVSFAHLNLSEFNLGQPKSKIQKGPQMIMNL